MDLKKVKDWSEAPLDSLLDYVIGGDWGKDVSYDDADYEVVYCIRGSEIRNWEKDNGSTASLRKVKRSSVNNRKLQEGDILVEISGGGPEQPVGRTVLINKSVLAFEQAIPKVCTNFLRLVRPSGNIDSAFLNYFLKLFYQSGDIVNYQGGSNNLRNLKFPDYLKILVPFPKDKTYQQKIVSKLEELFSKLDNGVESLKAVQQQLKVYRQAVLKWAFEIISGSQETLDDCCSKIVDCLHSTAKFTDTGYYCVDTTCIKNGEILWDKARYVNEATFQERISRLKPIAGDILFAREGTVGTTVVVPDNVELCLGQRMMIFRLRDTILPKYILYYFQSPQFKTQYQPLIGGSTSPHLNIRDIKRFSVITCSVSEQEKVVQEIESRLSVCDKIEETISHSLKEAGSLRQSILKQAFEGKLL